MIRYHDDKLYRVSLLQNINYDAPVYNEPGPLPVTEETEWDGKCNVGYMLCRSRLLEGSI